MDFAISSDIKILRSLHFLHCIESTAGSEVKNVSQDPMGWLKDFAYSNMEDMSTTADMSQDPMGWLKDFAQANMWDMSVTDEVFHDSMGWLKVSAL